MNLNEPWGSSWNKKGIVEKTWALPWRMMELDGWRALVEDYSVHQLTVPKAKLPALSGFASRVHKQMKPRYLAGLWERMLLLDLS